MAVGYLATPNANLPEEETTLTETWNGSTWSIQTSPNPENGNSSLTAVSCSSSAACSAVGTTHPGKATNSTRTFGERWG